VECFSDVGRFDAVGAETSPGAGDFGEDAVVVGAIEPSFFRVAGVDLRLGKVVACECVEGGLYVSFDG
jgi:hypothetical protein